MANPHETSEPQRNSTPAPFVENDLIQSILEQVYAGSGNYLAQVEEKLFREQHDGFERAAKLARTLSPTDEEGMRTLSIFTIMYDAIESAGTDGTSTRHPRPNPDTSNPLVQFEDQFASNIMPKLKARHFVESIHELAEDDAFSALYTTIETVQRPLLEHIEQLIDREAGTNEERGNRMLTMFLVSYRAVERSFDKTEP